MNILAQRATVEPVVVLEVEVRLRHPSLPGGLRRTGGDRSFDPGDRSLHALERPVTGLVVAALIPGPTGIEVASNVEVRSGGA